MSYENLLALADHLENNVKDSEFDMNHYGRRPECGTRGCIAGHCLGLMKDPIWVDWLGNPHADIDFGDFTLELEQTCEIQETEGGYAFETAQDWLGISTAEANDLFLKDLSQTREEAVAKVRKLADAQQKAEWDHNNGRGVNV